MSTEVPHNVTDLTSQLVDNTTVVALCIMYSISFTFGVVGNLFVVLTVTRDPGMRNATNLFICNLSMADLLYTIFITPINLLQNIYKNYIMGEIVCALTPFLHASTISASSYTLSVIAFDRYLAVCHPLKRFINPHRAKLIIAGIWTLSIAVTVPWTQVYQLERNENVYCLEKWSEKLYDILYFFIVIFSLIYAIPLVFIAICYTTVAISVWRRVKSVKSMKMNVNLRHRPYTASTPASASSGNLMRMQTPEGVMSQSSSIGLVKNGYYSSNLKPNSFVEIKRKPKDGQEQNALIMCSGGINKIQTVRIVKMLAVVVLIFGTFWLPLMTLFSLVKLGVEINNVVIPYAQWLGAANSCINPWIYCFYSKRYRRSFCRMLRCHTMGNSHSADHSSRIVLKDPQRIRGTRMYEL